MQFARFPGRCFGAEGTAPPQVLVCSRFSLPGKARYVPAGIDVFGRCDYRDHMTATLREAKAKLSEMVKRASQGEEVVITVHGKEMAKLVGLPGRAKKLDKKKWLAELAQLRKKTQTGIVGMTAQEIQDEMRADRV